MDIKVTLGCELPKEAWLTAAEHIEAFAPAIANFLKRVNIDDKGKQDAEEFLTDMQLAYTAMRYVAEYATDKCRFIPVPNKAESGGDKHNG